LFLFKKKKKEKETLDFNFFFLKSEVFTKGFNSTVGANLTSEFKFSDRIRAFYI